jgi:hypothetical protein
MHGRQIGITLLEQGTGTRMRTCRLFCLRLNKHAGTVQQSSSGLQAVHGGIRGCKGLRNGGSLRAACTGHSLCVCRTRVHGRRGQGEQALNVCVCVCVGVTGLQPRAPNTRAPASALPAGLPQSPPAAAMACATAWAACCAAGQLQLRSLASCAGVLMASALDTVTACPPWLAACAAADAEAPAPDANAEDTAVAEAVAGLPPQVAQGAAGVAAGAGAGLAGWLTAGDGLAGTHCSTPQHARDSSSGCGPEHAEMGRLPCACNKADGYAVSWEANTAYT